ncbi:hypothetical protein DYH55_17595 [Methylovirgula sp. 4M-Z18]|nr:hypothetical protein DYH55_17595 [Methylovirgula sp. 4M-Z18]
MGRDCWTPVESCDFQRAYAETWLRFIGVIDIRGIVVERAYPETIRLIKAYQYPIIRNDPCADPLALVIHAFWGTLNSRS